MGKTTYKPLIRPENRPFVAMGAINERKITPYITERFGANMVSITSTKNQSHYNTIDYADKITGDRVEVKSRTCGVKSFLDTLVGDNKVADYKKLIAEGKRCWFIFVFTDGTYEWEYTTENYDKNVKDQKARGMEAVRTAPSTYKNNYAYTTFNPNKLHLYIMVNNLSFVCDVCADIPAGVKKQYNYKNDSILTGKCLINIKDF